MRTRGPSLFAAVLFAGLTSTAAAHLMPSGHGTLNVVGAKAYVVLSLPVVAFEGPDAPAAVADHVLTAVELDANRAGLEATVRAGISVESGGQKAELRSVLLNLPTGEGHAAGRSTELMVMIVATFAKPPKAVSLESGLWGHGFDSLVMKGSVSRGGRTIGTGQFKLSPKAPRLTFSEPPSADGPVMPPPAAWRWLTGAQQQ